MSEWRTAKLAELASGTDAIAIGPFGSALKASEYTADGIPVVRGQNLNRGRYVDDSDLVYVPETVAHRLNRSMVRPGDLVFPHRGAIGAVGLVRGGDYLLSSSMMKFTGDPLQVDPAYLTYYFLGPGRRELLIRASTVGTPGIAQPLTSLRDIDVRLPPLVEQKAIADVLGALDDKIEANRKLAAVVDDLLAMRMGVLLQHSNHRAVLAEVAALNPDKRTPVVGGHLRYLDIASVSVGEYEWPPLSDWETAPGRARRGVQQGDIVWSSVRPKRRSHALILDEDPDLVVSTGLTVIRARPGRWATLYEVLRRPEFSAHLEAVATGSAYPAVKPDGFRSAQVPWLIEEDAMRFEAEAAPLRLRQAAAVRESRTLAALRESLLPKLMSGHLRVEEAELAVSEAV